MNSVARCAGTLGVALALLGPAAGTTQDLPTFDENVLEITPEVLDRFVAAAKAEAAERRRLAAADPVVAAAAARHHCLMRYEARLEAAYDLPEKEGRAELANVVKAMWAECAPGESPAAATDSTVAGWRACAAPFQAEGRKRMDAWQAALDRGDQDAVRREFDALRALNERVVARCGPEPEEDAGGFFDSDLPESPEDPYYDDEIQSALWDLEAAAEGVAVAAGHFTRSQYGVVRERVVAYLSYVGDDDEVGGYLFTPAELKALAAYRDRLTAAIAPLELM